MPIYEYKCTICNHHFDLMQKISEEPVNQCPECLNHSAVRLVSAAGFQLKGTGWYVTDFKNKNKEVSKKDSSPKEATAEKPSSPEAKKKEEK